MTSPSTTELAIASALNKLMTGKWFDITVIDNIARLLNVNPDGAARNTLLVLHCVHYSQMPPELRREIPELIAQCLGGDVAAALRRADPRRLGWSV